MTFVELFDGDLRSAASLVFGAIVGGLTVWLMSRDGKPAKPWSQERPHPYPQFVRNGGALVCEECGECGCDDMPHTYVDCLRVTKAALAEARKAGAR